MKIFLIPVLVLIINYISLSSVDVYYTNIARDANGNILTSQYVSLEVKIFDTDDLGTPVFIESHTIHTSEFGIYSIHVGEGTVSSGTFSSLDYSNNEYIVQFGIDPSEPFNSYNIIEKKKFLELVQSSVTASGSLSGGNSESGMLKPFSDLNERDGWTFTGVSETKGTPETWASTRVTGSPEARTAHTAIWTGKEMIIWGGMNGNSDALYTGYKYDPKTNFWTEISNVDGPSPRFGHVAIWTGTEMIIWGGFDNTNYLGDGYRYNPKNDTWTTCSSTDAPSERQLATAVWTGTKMIVWGGEDGSQELSNGSIYDPATDTWTSVTDTDAPLGRFKHTAVWTGTDMIVFGGTTPGSGELTDGASYNLENDTWTDISTVDEPIARAAHTAIWTGRKMIIFGGYNEAMNGSGYFNTGGIYDPASDTWVETNYNDAPAVRAHHSAVWIGSCMVVWGGEDHGTEMNTGSIYFPDDDSWTGMNVEANFIPEARYEHSCVWTGSEMIIWGGSYSDGVLQTGGVLSGGVSVFWFKKN